MNQFIYGALTMACAVAGLFFLKFWRSSRDRFFVFFAVAFWTLGLNWLVLGLTHPVPEARHQMYLIRVVAFGLIIAAILDKNRRS